MRTFDRVLQVLSAQRKKRERGSIWVWGLILPSVHILRSFNSDSSFHFGICLQSVCLNLWNGIYLKYFTAILKTTWFTKWHLTLSVFGLPMFCLQKFYWSVLCLIILLTKLEREIQKSPGDRLTDWSVLQSLWSVLLPQFLTDSSETWCSYT